MDTDYDRSFFIEKINDPDARSLSSNENYDYDQIRLDDANSVVNNRDRYNKSQIGYYAETNNDQEANNESQSFNNVCKLGDNVRYIRSKRKSKVHKQKKKRFSQRAKKIQPSNFGYDLNFNDSLVFEQPDNNVAICAKNSKKIRDEHSNLSSSNNLTKSESYKSSDIIHHHQLEESEDEATRKRKTFVDHEISVTENELDEESFSLNDGSNLDQPLLKVQSDQSKILKQDANPYLFESIDQVRF